MRRLKLNPGLTLIELLIVIGVVGLLTAIALGSFGKINQRSALRDTHASVQLALEGARSKSATGADGTDHGVRIDTDKITAFTGIDYSSGTKYVVPFPPDITASPSPTDIIYTRLTAQSNLAADTVITITSTKLGESITILLKSNGAIITN